MSYIKYIHDGNNESIKHLNQSHYRPGQAQRVPEVKVPRFRDNGTGWW